MKTSKSIFAIIGVVLLSSFLLFATAPTAHACSCIRPGPPQEMLEKSSAVFSGTVTDISRNLLGYGYNVKFDIEKIWKGVSDKNVVVSTGLGGGDCGFGFKEGEKYIVYAYGESSLSTGICSRTHLLNQADTDVSALGEWKTPISNEPPNVISKNSLNASTVGIVVIVLVLVGIVYKIVVSRRKPS